MCIRDRVLVDLHGRLGVPDERGDVGAQEVFPVAEPDDQGGVAARRDHRAGVVGVHREQREGALQAVDHEAHGGREVAALAVRAGHELRGDLGVGLGAELHLSLIHI